MKTTLRQGYLGTPLTIEQVMESNNGVTAYFESESEAQKFAKLLPAVCKGKAHGLMGYIFNHEALNEYGLCWKISDDRKTKTAWGVDLRRLPVNKTTGEINELGEKRRKAFCEALRKHCEVVASLI
jgi:hypothetical protein